MIADVVAALVGSAVLSTRPVGGGDINDAYCVRLDDGRWLFAKANDQAPPRFFAAETRGLSLLASTGAVRVPEVVAQADTVLALEWIEPWGSVDDERLGRALARLHQAPTEHFGLDHDNYVGSISQPNTPCETWPEFYATRRLEPLVRRNVDAGRLPIEMVDQLGQLVRQLPERCGPAEPPSLLHGDLWSGNCMGARPSGEPVVFDPAVYGGHREIDLAMMQLFGGFNAKVFGAYHESYPLAEGHQNRVRLYQLYPLLVHVTLFGGSYAMSFLDALARYV